MKLNPDWFDWQQTRTLVKAFGDDANKLRFVGGAVRDSLLGIAVNDVDAATIFTPEETIKLLEKAGIKAIPTGIKHGTVTAHINGKNFEITTLRRDTSCDGRHAEVEYTDNWREDAARRDFTMNALYMTTDGEILDYFNGIEDAKAGRVRFIGNAHERVQEDYLRILRFFRFYAYYGKSVPDENALKACNDFALKIESLSGERIQHEMLKLLASPYAFTALEYMQTYILKEVCGFSVHLKNALKRLPPDYKKRLVVLLLSADIDRLEALDILAQRWRLSHGLKKYFLMVATNINTIFPNLPLDKQKHLIRKLGKEIYSEIIMLKKALEEQNDFQKMLEFAEDWQIPTMPVSGKDLVALGISQGKELGEKLHRLEMLWEESDYKLNKEELLKKL